MRAGADTVIERAGEDAACAQFADHAIRGDASSCRIEEDQVRFRLLHSDAGNLCEAACKSAGIGMIVGQRSI